MNIKEIIERHDGQKWGEYPYSEHLSRVHNIAQLLNSSFDEKIIEQAAWSHDLLEDTKTVPEELDENIRESIILISRNHSQTDFMCYQEYIQKIADSGDALAILIKLSDALANHWLCKVNGSTTLVKRYEKSIPVLINAFLEQ